MMDDDDAASIPIFFLTKMLLLRNNNKDINKMTTMPGTPKHNHDNHHNRQSKSTKEKQFPVIICIALLCVRLVIQKWTSLLPRTQYTRRRIPRTLLRAMVL